MYKGAKIENENKAQGEVPYREMWVAYSAGREMAKPEGDTVTQYKQ